LSDGLGVEFVDNRLATLLLLLRCVVAGSVVAGSVSAGSGEISMVSTSSVAAADVDGCGLKKVKKGKKGKKGKKKCSGVVIFIRTKVFPLKRHLKIFQHATSMETYLCATLQREHFGANKNDNT
jgi:hypothetical protein